MGKGRRRNRSTAKQRRSLPAVPATVDDLPDELLDRLLLYLGSPLDLIRAAATCKRWRRTIADKGFLGRSYAIHGAPRVAGHYYVTDTQPPDVTGVLRWPPQKPAAFVPTSPAVVDGSLFSLDFLYVPPEEADRPRRRYYYNYPRRVRHNRCREIVDSRGSLLLLTNGPRRESIHPRRWSPDFIVCESVSRRYQGIARPADLSHLPLLGAFLLDGGGGGDTMSNFRVLSVLYEPDRWRYQFGTPRACVFAPGSDGGWHLCWHTMDDGNVDVPLVETIHLAGRAAGRVYWGIEDGTVLVLDESTLKFSLLTFPSQMRGPYRRTSFRVIGSGVDGEDKAARVVRVDGEELEVFGQLPDFGEWVMEKSIRLRDATAGLPGGRDYRFFRLPARIVTAGNTFVVLTPAEKTWLFSVELETMEVEREHVRNRHIGPSYPCALPWPPVLQACVHRGDDVVGKRRRQRRKGW
ncbi:hypothetical protein GQ55_2G221600 [Panicum hallii var. hallii]|uniref:F-box domain-containing protein n=1 Tax=Panicum hallii var. hallii TaxID=1504633 RepID=A0A2T7ER87_9POAL|nr:hypothetical protein GQ55_2G221600 [Panicum hallii var. hallii]